MARNTIKQNAQMSSSAQERDKQEFLYGQGTLQVDSSTEEDQNKAGKFSHVTALCSKIYVL